MTDEQMSKILKRLHAIVRTKKRISVDAVVKYELIEITGLGRPKANTPKKYLN